MSFKNFLHNVFGHVNNHTLAGALAAAKVTLEQLNNIEHWPWFPQFETAATSAITALNVWEPGQPKTQIVQSLNLAVSILNGVEGLSQKDKATISVFVGAAESALAFLG